MIHCRRPFIEFASMAGEGTPKKYQSIPGLNIKVISLHVCMQSVETQCHK